MVESIVLTGQSMSAGENRWIIYNNFQETKCPFIMKAKANSPGAALHASAPHTHGLYTTYTNWLVSTPSSSSCYHRLHNQQPSTIRIRSLRAPTRTLRLRYLKINWPVNRFKCDHSNIKKPNTIINISGEDHYYYYCCATNVCLPSDQTKY